MCVVVVRGDGRGAVDGDGRRRGRGRNGGVDGHRHRDPVAPGERLEKWKEPYLGTVPSLRGRGRPGPKSEIPKSSQIRDPFSF